MNDLVLFDGDCRFCRRWVDYLRLHSHQAQVDIQYLLWQKVFHDPQYKSLKKRTKSAGIDEKSLEKRVYLLKSDNSVHSGADCVLKVLDISKKFRFLHYLYRKSRLFSNIFEYFYHLVARNRKNLAFLAPSLDQPGQASRSTFHTASNLFLKSLGLCYLIAFSSLFVQIEPLYGSKGILPIQEVLAFAEKEFTSIEKATKLPSIFHIFDQDSDLFIFALLGSAFSLALILGSRWIGSLFIPWVIYLSFCAVGRDFLSFQWDILLIECGFLSLFALNLNIYPINRQKRTPTFKKNGLRLLFVLLLFKLMFSSGVVKLSHGDPTWLSLEALDYHFLTQPLPTGLAWHAHHLPGSLHKAMLLITLVIELLFPFFFFGPRFLRIFAGIGTILLMFVIFLTGNYTFFNILTVILCLWLFDDAFFSRFSGNRHTSTQFQQANRPHFSYIFPVALVYVVLSIFQTVRAAVPTLPYPGWVQKVSTVLAPYRVVSAYGLFRVMTTQRLEIIVEGSNTPHDEESWKAYDLKYKPGSDLSAGYRWVQPHQPRLDWQMWFAALGGPEQNPWFMRWISGLLHGNAGMLQLASSNPFPNKPPRYIRSRLFRYTYTAPEERIRTGHWWKRKALGVYTPPVYLLRETN